MLREREIEKLSAAPNDDIELVINYFNDKCNCYSYAVQDYLAGYLSDDNNDDFHYLPRPGQSRGTTYTDLIGDNVEGMRRAVHEDGLDFAGTTYPKKIPKGHYVICCFLEPGEYHFIRQNKDGSWSSKNGRYPPNKNDAFGQPLTNPENYYHGDPNYKFVGYFFVPEGGIHVGVRAYEQNRLNYLQDHAKTPDEKNEKEILARLTVLSDTGNEVKNQVRDIFYKNKKDSFEKISEIWEEYLAKFKKMSIFCSQIKYTRRNSLKKGVTRKKKSLILAAFKRKKLR